MAEDNIEDDIIEDDNIQETNEIKTERYSTIVDQGQDLIRIDKFLDDHIPGISRNKIQEAAKSDCIIVNGKPVKSNYRVHPGDEVKVL
ncbi:MAG: RNA pseudouridine synthase, partial [Bacteroidales bacterium]|nr:RNA pseudouridine synthase [Bacteroidales bacterium]